MASTRSVEVLERLRIALFALAGLINRLAWPLAARGYRVWCACA